MNIALKLVGFRTFVVAILIAAFAVQLVMIPEVTQAAPSPFQSLLPFSQSAQACVGLDLVLLIDQSGSNDRTDVGNYRINAAHAIINGLGSNRLYFCPSTVHRLAVISFGDGNPRERGVRFDLPSSFPSPPFVEISPDRNNLDAWYVQRNMFEDSVKADNMGHTDFQYAFRYANNAFMELDKVPKPNDQPRRKAVILLTDGNPCVFVLGCVKKSLTLKFDDLSYMNDLREYIDVNFPVLTDDQIKDNQGVRLWVVALRDDESYLDRKVGSEVGRPIDTTIREYWQNLARSRGGDLIELTRSQADIPTQVYSLVLRNLISSGRAIDVKCNERRYIDPYTETIRFVIFKNLNSSDAVIKFDAGGDLIELPQRVGEVSKVGKIVEYLKESNTEIYVINRPKPGYWTVTSRLEPDNCSSQMSILQELIEPVATLLEPNLPIVTTQQAPFLIYEIKERGSNNPFPIDINYPLSLTAVITTPNNTITKLNLIPYSSKGGSAFRSDQPVPISNKGTYSVTLSIGIVDPRTQTSSRIYPDINKYNVTPEIIQIEMIEPRSVMSASDASRPQPIRFRLRKQTSDRSVVDPATIFGDNLDQALDITTQNGQKIKISRAAGDRNIIEGFLDAPEGSYTITASVIGGYSKDLYEFSSDKSSISIQRVNALFYTIDVTEPRANSDVRLNSVDTNGIKPLPFQIQAKISDSAVPFADKSNVLSATLVNTSGLAFETITLKPDQEPGSYSGKINALPGEGDYQLVVGLVQTPTDPRYLAKEASIQIPFRAVKVAPMTIQIHRPQPNSTLGLHVEGWQAALDQVYPLVVTAQLTHAGKLYEPAEVLAGGTNGQIGAQLIGPSGFTRAVTLTVASRPEGNVLEGVLSDLPAEVGNYRLTLNVAREQLAARYELVEVASPLSFRRNDLSFWSNPWVWRVIGLLLALACLAIIVFVIILIRTAPAGNLSIAGVNIPLGIHHRLLGIRRSDLKALGIGSIQVVRDRSIPGTKAIRVTIYDTERQPIIVGDQLESGDSTGGIPLEGGRVGTLRYQ